MVSGIIEVEDLVVNFLNRQSGEMKIFNDQVAKSFYQDH